MPSIEQEMREIYFQSFSSVVSLTAANGTACFWSTLQLQVFIYS